MRTIDQETVSMNDLSIVGTVESITVTDGKAKKDGHDFRSADINIRVCQDYSPVKGEVSIIPVRMMANKFTKSNELNKLWENLGKLKTTYSTIQDVGIGEASRVIISSSGSRQNGRITENTYASRNNPDTIVSTWSIGATFINPTKNDKDAAQFKHEIFVMSMDREISKDGEETGRLKIRGGLITYGKHLNILTYYVMNPSGVEFFENNVKINDTIVVQGRVRCTSEEVSSTVSTLGWGDDTDMGTTTKYINELIITRTPTGEPNEEDASWDPQDIRVLAADRSNSLEQKKIDARAAAQKATKAPKAAPAIDSWEE